MAQFLDYISSSSSAPKLRKHPYHCPYNCTWLTEAGLGQGCVVCYPTRIRNSHNREQGDATWRDWRLYKLAVQLDAQRSETAENLRELDARAARARLSSLNLGFALSECKWRVWAAYDAKHMYKSSSLFTSSSFSVWRVFARDFDCHALCKSKVEGKRMQSCAFWIRHSPRPFLQQLKLRESLRLKVQGAKHPSRFPAFSLPPNP